jgi:hypothetical protein
VAFDVHVQIESINDHSTGDKRRNWIEHSGVNWSLTQPKVATASPTRSGSRTRRPSTGSTLRKGYQGGVVDETQGNIWCAPARMKPGEVDDRIWSELRKRRGAMPGSAAAVLLVLYACRLPCP